MSFQQQLLNQPFGSEFHWCKTEGEVRIEQWKQRQREEARQAIVQRMKIERSIKLQKGLAELAVQSA